MTVEGHWLGLIIPTRNNPRKLAKTLTALAAQDQPGLRVVVIGSGDDQSGLISQFRSTLDLDYLHSEEGGQVHQRNLGIGLLLGEKFRYIGFWDDDVIAQKDCISAIRAFIEAQNLTGAIDFALGLNIEDEDSFAEIPFRRMQRLLRRIGTRPGEVTVTGMITPIANVSSDITTQWVGGGYTIWSANILKKYPQEPMRTRHAAGEDLIYSYPLGKIYPLFVCAQAKVIHDDSGIEDPAVIRFRMERSTIAHLYFCDQHKEFSSILYLCFGLIFQIALLAVPKRNAWRKLVGFLSGVKRYYSNLGKGPAVLDDEYF